MSIGMPKYCEFAVYKNIKYLPSTGDGAESVENLYLQQVKQLSKNSPTSCLCHDVKTQLIVGNGFNCCENIIDFLEFEKIVKDFIMFNGFSMSVIKDSENNIIKLLHEPFEFVRFYYKCHDSEPTFISNNNWDKKLATNNEILKTFTVADFFYHNANDNKFLYPYQAAYVSHQMFFDSKQDCNKINNVRKIETIISDSKRNIVNYNFPSAFIDLSSETTVRSSVKSFDNSTHGIKRKFERLFNNILRNELELLGNELTIVELDFEKKATILKNLSASLVDSKLN